MSTPKLYTLIIDYRGGTYVTQCTASNMHEAPAECINNWNIQDIEKEVSEYDRQEILNSLKDQDFVLLNGMKNIWCGCVLLNDELVQMNLVETCNTA